jgi:iron complex outermembrane receptor protein
MASLMNLAAKYDKDENYQGKTPVDAPEWSASIWSRYELTDQLALNAGAFYQGERFADSDNTISKDAYTRIDIGATYKTTISGQGVDFRCNIQNLLDTEYLAGGGISSVTAGDGISYRLAAQISF